MNIYLLELIGKWLNLLLISLVSLTGFVDYTQETRDIIMKNKDANLTVESSVIRYDTVTKYNDALTTDVKNVLVSGQDGIVYVDNNGNVVKTIQEKVDEVIEVGTINPHSYLGTLTAYGPDCVGCTGQVACTTREGYGHNLYTDGIKYTDSTYGEVRILAAYLPEFPCGTVIDYKDSNGNIETGIVLDTGGAMINAWNRGQVLIDLAYPSEQSGIMGTKFNVRFDVKRFGW